MESTNGERGTPQEQFDACRDKEDFVNLCVSLIAQHADLAAHCRDLAGQRDIEQARIGMMARHNVELDREIRRVMGVTRDDQEQGAGFGLAASVHLLVKRHTQTGEGALRYTHARERVVEAAIRYSKAVSGDDNAEGYMPTLQQDSMALCDAVDAYINLVGE